MFIPLKLIFPHAHIPVVQLSLHESLEPEKHLATGQALQALIVLLHGVGSSELGVSELGAGLGPTNLVALVGGPLALGPEQFA